MNIEQTIAKDLFRNRSCFLSPNQPFTWAEVASKAPSTVTIVSR